jgi:hypothetical protein
MDVSRWFYLIPKLMLFKPEKVCALLKHSLMQILVREPKVCVGLKAEHGTRSSNYHFVESLCYSTTTHELKGYDLWSYPLCEVLVHTLLAEPSNPTTGKHVFHPSQNYRCELLWWMKRFWRPLVQASVVSFFRHQYPNRLIDMYL